MTDQKRSYQKKRRAELEEQTRLRITEAAEQLHGTVGPAHTSVSAVAALAGVRRSTVYRHFPDEAALFEACRSHWIAANPPPDLAAWAAIKDPEERLVSALRDLYSYYGATELMMFNLYRDEATVPTVKQMFAMFRGYLRDACDVLMHGWRARGGARKRLRAAIGHAVAFSTWRSLAREQGLDDNAAAELMRRLAAAAAGEQSK